MPTIGSMPGRTLQWRGQEWLYFSGTSYLGINKLPAFQQLLLEGLDRYGTNFGGSRLSNLQFSIFEETESYFTKLTGAEGAITFSSGTLAGQILVKWLKNKGKFFYAPFTHPAVFDEGEYSEMDFNGWVAYLLDRMYSDRHMNLVLFSNALDPLRAEQYRFDWLNELPKDREIILVIDDSHGLGICGEKGEGIYPSIEVPYHIQKIVVGSLGKAFGIPGGIILGKKSLINALWKTPFVGGASPVTPAYLHAFLKAEELYQKQRERLQERIQQFKQAVRIHNLFRSIPDYPIFYTRKNELANFLYEQKTLISSFPYPTKKDPIITRIVLNALHTERDIDELASQIDRFV